MMQTFLLSSVQKKKDNDLCFFCFLTLYIIVLCKQKL